MVVPAVAARDLMVLKVPGMVIRHPLPHRKATMVPLMREAWPIKSAVAAVEQELLAQPALLVARQEMAGMDYPAVLVALQPTMLEGAVVIKQPMGAPAMVVLAVEALDRYQALQTLAAAVAASAVPPPARPAAPES